MKRKKKLIILSGLITPLTGILGSVVSNAWNFIPFWLSWPLVFVLVLAGIVVAVRLDTLQGISQLTSDESHRQRILEIEEDWITDQLKQSLQIGAYISLDLREQPGSVANPRERPFELSDQPTSSLLTAAIVPIYKRAHGKLLVLGEPGSGKTTLLLELARYLVTLARPNSTLPIPVVCNLSSWVKKRLPIQEWLEEALVEVFSSNHTPVPLQNIHSWISDDRVLPLLDGLDELPSGSRADCVNAINTYLEKQHFGPLVVCCRSVDYQAQKPLLQLHNAVVIQPLTPKQLGDYLSTPDGQWEAVRVALSDDPPLRGLASTPLMLNVLARTYDGRSVNDLLRIPPPERRQYILAAYVQRMLEHRGGSRYSLEQTKYWLGWLAQQMVQHSQIEFYIEQMRLDWLPMGLQRLRRLLVGLCIGLIFGLCIGPFIGPFIGLHDSGVSVDLVYGVYVGLVAAIVGMMAGDRMDSMGHIWVWPDQSIWSFLQVNILSMLLTAVVLGLGLGLGAGLFVGALFALIGVLSWAFGHPPTGLPSVLIFAIVIMSAMGLVPGLGSGLSKGFGESLWETNGSAEDQRMQKIIRMIPNQGVWYAALCTVIMGLLAGLFFGLLAWLLAGQFYGLLAGVLITVSISLYGVGFATIQYGILRFLLWLTRHTPLRYRCFLDYAAECLLLRKIDHGYSFHHGLLRDYFANVDATSSSKKEARLPIGVAFNVWVFKMRHRRLYTRKRGKHSI